MASILPIIALRNLRRHWRHSLGASLAIAVGFAAISLFGGYVTDMVRMIGEMMEERFMMGTLIVEGRGASEVLSGKRSDEEGIFLDEAEQAFVDEYLRDHAGELVTRVRSLFVVGVATNGRASTPFNAWGYDPAEGAAVRRRYAWDTWAGRPLHEAGEDAVLLGRGLGKLLDCTLTSDDPVFGPDGTPIPKERPFACRRPRVQLMGSTASGQVNAVSAVVAGIVDPGTKEMDAQFVSLPLALAQRFADTRDVSMYTILLRDPAAGERFARDLSAAAAARGLAIDAIPWQESHFGLMYRQSMDFFAIFRGFMTLVVVGISGAAVFSTMAKAVNERTREVGTLRSLGFVRRQITALFTLEALLLSLGACVVGLGITLLVTGLVDAAGITYTTGTMANSIPLGVDVDPLGYLQVAAFLVAISVLAAWRPARHAARMRIPDALAWA